MCHKIADFFCEYPCYGCRPLRREMKCMTRGLITGEPISAEYLTRCCAAHGELQLKTKTGQVVKFTSVSNSLTVAAVTVLVHGETSVVAQYETVCPTPCNGCLSRELHSLIVPGRNAPQSAIMSLI